jgi:hypothetical protein
MQTITKQAAVPERRVVLTDRVGAPRIELTNWLKVEAVASDHQNQTSHLRSTGSTDPSGAIRSR